MDARLEAVHTLVSAEAEQLGVPGMAVGVLRNAELASVRGYGTFEKARGIDADTVFRIGSVTKVFTATAAP